MSWEVEPLTTKATLFFSKAFDEERDSIFFGLHCAMGLELLVRASISKFSPTLLADPDRDQQNLLYALNLPSGRSSKKSIATNQALSLCKLLIPEFSDSHFKNASAITTRRNEEVHSGGAAFSEYAAHQWIGNLYEICIILADHLGVELKQVLGADIAEEAIGLVEEMSNEVIGNVKASIAAHKKVWEQKDAQIRLNLHTTAQKKSELLARNLHHRVQCPSCNCIATVTGNAVGKLVVETDDLKIVERQSIAPNAFHCTACELKLGGFQSLNAAGVGDYYTRRTTYTPEDYYDMVSTDDQSSIEEIFLEHNPTIEGYALSTWDND